jgi:D-alanine--poly(phosphoribitol) ligase subunit 1
MSVEFVNRQQITVWSSVPTLANQLKMLGLLKPATFPSLRLSLFCGEALPSRLAAAWQDAAPSTRILNLYGPTEATVFSTIYVWDSASPPKGRIVPLGKPLRSFSFRILGEDESMSGARVGCGELLLTGAQVVPGYWRDPASTERSFIRLSGDVERRVWYRTGDLVSFDEREGLLFRGRSDDQVKLRGHRILLSEIEAVIRRVTDADMVAVVAVLGDDSLCEDLVVFCNKLGAPADQIKRRCGRYLADYMLPRYIELLDRFPINENGKIDYAELSAQASALLAGSGHNLKKKATDGPD